ncbi:N-acetyllactosaminide beta-1,3-N-acetylglucosaminyltransferase 2a [Mastacembelus armatus]|uniref:Hexosyltransferase n=1 Tax=Mastacembelus armatus TaxID=205130 RepID=A0A3Q3NL90_9TELE|nr:N-acetyllactosaminide beta-1,3-N-acetylglucosaminyltransferase 2 [Mastacembelus armatus]XP_026160046.1 N-acetyllactosaminide beta-1,3-N-acetylglucosaminyltransferase 2 [Mastacembelus armatus]XP_026160048.1 N-acetyllactosaminide beta-1,3-N-acetylglucosaminyltransferase 2 [Mastacembelus armatus]XP_026160049.1 N-acetyllactosaminide beta-1,3-N-acetylglucosaminyltransferase 2 [Mastacembelus armatus]
MFPDAPLDPRSARGGNMTVVRTKVGVFCVVMMLNVFVCILMFLSWNKSDKSGHHLVLVPSQGFWQQNVLSKSFWNREQQRLDFIYNPIINSAFSSNSFAMLPHWLNETGPLNPCEPDYRVHTQIKDYNSLPQRFQDFLLYMHCRTFPLLINQPHVCDDTPFLLLAVKSLVPHFDRRQAIRETWGRAGVLANRTVVTVFLLGSTLPTDHFPDLLWLLVHEAALHKDLIQWDYRDTFFNLTLKEVLFLEWFSKHCPKAQYILKGDDDVFVNTLRIVDLLKDLSEVKAKDLFIGDVISNAGPHRNQKLKYFIPESVFEGQYPDYAGGGGYLFSGQLALRLYNISWQVALYPIDDVYTGMCLNKLGLAPEKHTGFRTFDIEEKYRSTPCIYRSLMLVHGRTPQEMLKLWPWIIHPELDCQ